MSSHLWKQSAWLVLGAGVFVASAYAAKECQDLEDFAPGVDAEGNLSDNPELGGVIQCRACINTNNGKIKAKCEGTVTNESGDNQKYKNDPFINELIGEGVTKSLYKVKANGAAKLTVKGQGPPPGVRCNCREL